jgi:hypothetical protein
MQPMSTFDPNLPSRVHDRLNDRTLEWKTGWAGKYRQYARMVSENGQGVIYFDGPILDGCAPLCSRMNSQTETQGL